MIGFSTKSQAKARSAESERDCDHPDCAEAGEHRAPRSREQIDSYYWFCLEHARNYNAAWNYFIGMNQHEIEDYQKADITWHRPTWRIGGNRRMNGDARINAAWRRGDFTDPYCIFDKDEDPTGPDALARRMPVGERQALAILNLPFTATDSDIKARYKELVKRLHPDVNGEDEKAVDQLKFVIEAYRTLSKRTNP